MKYEIVTLNPGNTAQWQRQLNDMADAGYELKQIVLYGGRNLAVFERIASVIPKIVGNSDFDLVIPSDANLQPVSPDLVYDLEGNPIEETVTSEVMTAEVE